jgi:acetyl-CoA carboxylase biotin carboxyl carrier protein
VDLDKLRELIQIFEASEISEIEVEEEGSRILLRKSKPAQIVTPASLGVPQGDPIAAAAPAVPQQAPAPEAPPPSEAPEQEEEEQLATIDSPMVGVFYAAPAPGEPPFVQPGDAVEPDDAVCIVEAMKLMNEVTAKQRCTIVKVLVENAEPVEYGQPLFAVRPA